MIDPVASYCAALQVEHDAISHWSEVKDRLQRIGWNAGCTWVESPQADIPNGAEGNWASESRQPPRSYTAPGNPDNRLPPEY